MSAQKVFSSAIAVTGSALRQHGFRRRGSKLTRTGGEVVSLIEFQRSRSSTAAYITFVINYGVAVSTLADAEGVDTAKLWWTQCHWRTRVLGKDGHEAWWPVRADDDPDQIATRLTHRVQQEVLPETPFTLRALQALKELEERAERG